MDNNSLRQELQLHGTTSAKVLQSLLGTWNFLTYILSTHEKEDLPHRTKDLLLTLISQLEALGNSLIHQVQVIDKANRNVCTTTATTVTPNPTPTSGDSS